MFFYSLLGTLALPPVLSSACGYLVLYHHQRPTPVALSLSHPAGAASYVFFCVSFSIEIKIRVWVLIWNLLYLDCKQLNWERCRIRGWRVSLLWVPTSASPKNVVRSAKRAALLSKQVNFPRFVVVDLSYLKISWSPNRFCVCSWVILADPF